MSVRLSSETSVLVCGNCAPCPAHCCQCAWLAARWMAPLLLPMEEANWRTGSSGSIIGQHFTKPAALTLWCRHKTATISQTFYENVLLAIKISLKFVPKGPKNNIPSLVHIMDWRRPCDKPLSEPMMVRLQTHTWVTRPRWVNSWHMPWRMIKCLGNVFKYQIFHSVTSLSHDIE